ncbi:hypothetical protein G3I40_03590 [Streptomyces sp. SID14478]|nr:hypothetical protein [Streptomyces sp. SID14478]NEB74321.1 hypothetical protein [Streptomyces sp. SID14478]
MDSVGTRRCSYEAVQLCLAALADTAAQLERQQQPPAPDDPHPELLA